jgi:MoxR-like ATPase
MTTKEYAVLKVHKIDNGFRGIILNKSDRGLWEYGGEFFNRKLHPYTAGTELNVTVRISPSGRRMVQKVEIAKEAPVKEGKGMSASEFVAKATGGKASLPAGAISGSMSISLGEYKETFEEMSSASREALDKLMAATVTTGTPQGLRPVPRKSIVPVSKEMEGYYVSPQARLVFNTAKSMSDREPARAIKMMMVGPSGYGKTTLPRLFAELAGKGFLRMNCATVRDPEEWFGYREAKDGNTVFVRSAFAKALEEGNKVVVLDEFNRLEPWLHNTLFPLLDDDGATVVHDEKFTIGPGIIVVGTINTGYKYTGTFELDEALLNRFQFILEVGALPREEENKVLISRTGVKEEDAKDIVKMSAILRNADVSCSTRTSLLVASMVAGGMTKREAFESVVVCRIPVDSSGGGQRKQVIDLINTKLGALTTRKLSNDIFNGIKLEVQDSVGDSLEISPTPEQCVLFLKKAESNIWLRVQIIQKLRSLPITGESGGDMTLREAQALIAKLEDGEKCELVLSERPVDMGDIVSRLSAYGVNATFAVMGG